MKPPMPCPKVETSQVSCYTFSDAPVDSPGDDGCVADLHRRIAKAMDLSEAASFFVFFVGRSWLCFWWFFSFHINHHCGMFCFFPICLRQIQEILGKILGFTRWEIHVGSRQELWAECLGDRTFNDIQFRSQTWVIRSHIFPPFFKPKKTYKHILEKTLAGEIPLHWI